MFHLSLDSIRESIKREEKQETVGVAEVDDKHVVVNNFGTDNETTYVCQNIEDAADCVTHLIFDIPIEATPANSITEVIDFTDYRLLPP